MSSVNPASHSPTRTHDKKLKMRFPIKLFTLLVLALLATSAVAWKPISKGDAEACKKKNPDIAQAIGSFCQRFPMVGLSPP